MTITVESPRGVALGQSTAQTQDYPRGPPRSVVALGLLANLASTPDGGNRKGAGTKPNGQT